MTPKQIKEILESGSSGYNTKADVPIVEIDRLKLAEILSISAEDSMYYFREAMDCLYPKLVVGCTVSSNEIRINREKLFEYLPIEGKIDFEQ